MKKSVIAIILTAVVAGPGTALFASYEEALSLFQQKKYNESLKIVAEELFVVNDMKPDSQNYKLRFLAAHLHWKLGNTNAAITHFRRCMEIKKDTVDPYIDLSLFLIELGRYGDAADIARKGLEVDSSAMLYFVLGRVAMIQKSYWQAKTFLEKANSIDPEMYISYNELGIALMRLKKYSQANTAFSAALAQRPDSAEILNNIGMSLELLGEKDQAREYYKKALEQDEGNKVIRANLERVKGQ